MDIVKSSARSEAGHRGFSEFRQICAGSSLSNWFLHAGRITWRRPFQEGNPGGEPELFAVDSRRGRTSWTASKFTNIQKYPSKSEQELIIIVCYLWKQSVTQKMSTPFPLDSKNVSSIWNRDKYIWKTCSHLFEQPCTKSI